MQPERPLGGYLRAISNALSQDMQQKTEQLGLTSSQGMFLHYIRKRSKIDGLDTYPKDLEDFFYIKHPTVSGILQRMETAGFVVLTASKSDKRCKAIILTQKALDAHAQIEAHIKASEERLTRGMSEEEQSSLRLLLKQAADNLGVCRKRPIIQDTEKEEKVNCNYYNNNTNRNKH